MSDPSSSSSSSSSSPGPPANAMTTTTVGTAPPRKRHREGQIDQAYTLQRDAAVKGMLIWTLIGGSSVFMAHHLFPGFRKQTLALKGFITSGATIFGLCTSAEDVLQAHESSERVGENLIRTRARQELGKEGKLASESEIEQWKKSEREKLLGRLREERIRSKRESEQQQQQ